MFEFQKKDQIDFGFISPSDDRDIEVVRLKNESRQGLWTESLKLIRDIILIIAVFILLGVFVAQPVVVEGTSMLPQLHDGERLLVNKLVYYKFKSVSWGHIERGDIVVFWFPNDPDKSYVKRVIGLPGETVEVRNGRIYINAQELQTFRPQPLPLFVFEPHDFYIAVFLRLYKTEVDLVFFLKLEHN